MKRIGQRIIISTLFCTCAAKDEFSYYAYKLFGVWLPLGGCKLATKAFNLQEKWGFVEKSPTAKS